VGEARGVLYGVYYFAQLYSYELAKWNVNTAYASFKTAINNSLFWFNPEHLWTYGGVRTIKATNATYAGTTWGRYYDEKAEVLSCFLMFNALGISDALTEAVKYWDNINDIYWYAVAGQQHFGYIPYPPSEFECEAGGFEQIMIQLLDADGTIGNQSRLLTDLETRYFSSNWTSYQWAPYGAVAHNNQISPRLPNTIMSWASILGFYLVESAADQATVQRLLEGYGTYGTAWQLLLNATTGLYNATSGQFAYTSGTPVFSNDATAMGACLLMLEGIVPKTASLAIPLEEYSYEYTNNIIDGDLFNMSLAAHTLTLAIQTAGTCNFIYNGTTSYTFNATGLWQLTFDSDWNTILSGTRLGNFPTSRTTFYDVLLPPAPAIVTYAVSGDMTLKVNGTMVGNSTVAYSEDDVLELTEFGSADYLFTYLDVAGTIISDNPFNFTLAPGLITITAYTTFIDFYSTIFYPTSDSHTVNFVSANILNETQGSTATTKTLSAAGSEIAYVGYRVYVMCYDGNTTELTSGTPEAICGLANETEALVNASWIMPRLPIITLSDALDVELYLKIGTGVWLKQATFTTAPLEDSWFNGSTFVFQTWANRTYSGGNTILTVRYGNSTYNTVLYGVTMKGASVYDLINHKYQSGDFIGAILLPYTNLVGNLFYGLIMLLICVPMYRRYQSFTPILILFFLLGGIGGFIGLLIPVAASGIAWLFLVIGLAGLIYKVIR
jgi:hypothetical protein